MQFSPDISDVDLMLRAARHDDREAFAELVKRHQQPLANFFMRSGVYDGVEDLVQETFIRLFRYRSRYQPRAKFTTFLYLLARQVRIDMLRRLKRRKDLHERAGAELPQTIQPSAAARGAGIDLTAALAQLSEPMRDVVILAVLQGLPQKEVAEVLKIPVGTVKSRLFVALGRLREYLGQGDTE